MASLKATYGLLKYPKKETYQEAGDYLFSKRTTRELPNQKNYGDDIKRNVEVRLYCERKALDTTEKRLSALRASSVEKRLKLDKQWADLARREVKLRNTFKDFNAFVKENTEKRVRAAIKAQEQNELCRERAIQILDIKYEYDDINKVKTGMQKTVDMYKIYEEYLDNVVETSGGTFSTIMDILKRYEALILAKHELTDLLKKRMDQLSAAKLNLNQTLDNYSYKLSGLNNRVASLRQRYEEAKLRCQKWEKIIQSIMAEAAEKVITLVTIQNSCWQIYKDICRRKDMEPVFENDYAKQFAFIKQSLYEFGRINNMVKALEEEKKEIV